MRGIRSLDAVTIREPSLSCQVPDAAEELSNIEAILSKNDFGAQATKVWRI